MQIYPAIDVKNGNCIRLSQGDFSTATVYHTHPETLIKQFAEDGTTWLHMVDLDAAKNPAYHQYQQIIRWIRPTDTLQIQLGGGIRSSEQIAYLLANGISRVIIGSHAINQPEAVKTWFEIFGPEKLVLAFDIKYQGDEIPYVALNGWQQLSNISVIDILHSFQDVGIKHILCTDISRDGLLTGPNLLLYQEILKQFPQLQIQASGGIANLQDLQNLKNNKLAGAIIGRAIYEKKFTLREALAC